MNLYPFIFMTFINSSILGLNPDLLYGNWWYLNGQETTENRLVYNPGYSINALEFNEENKLRKMTYWARCGNDTRKTSYANGAWKIETVEGVNYLILNFDDEAERFKIETLSEEELVLIPEK